MDQPPLGPVQRRALDSLRRDGLAMVPFAELIDDEDLWAELEEDVRAFADDAEQVIDGRGERARKPKKVRKKRKANKADFIVRATAIQGKAAPPEFLRYALSEQLLAICNSYLGLQSKLTYIDKWYTVPIPESAERVRSQRWHRDHIDPHIVKVFTYFSDVDADAGPLEYVRGSAADGPYGDLWAWSAEGSTTDHYPPDGELERLVEPSDCLRAEGPAGTIVLCDTGGFHRGGFGDKPRVTANFTYVSPAALAESRAKRRFEVEEELPAELSPAARFALS